MALTTAEKARLKKAGLSGLNKPKRTPKHRTKKAVVAVRVGGKVKIIRFGAQGMGHNYSPEARKSFKARHGRVNLPQPIGQTKYFGQEKVDLKRCHLSPKNMLEELNEGKNDSTKSNRQARSLVRWFVYVRYRATKKC
jgi:hypothetical protein